MLINTREGKNMESKELLTQLLKGQQNMDRMRREIDWLIGMVIGYVKTYGEGVHPDARTFVWNGEHGRWIMKVTIPMLGSKELVVEYEAVVGFTAYSSGGGAGRLKPNHVQRTHEDLAYFLQGIDNEFPQQLKESWEPFVRAALVEF